MRQFRPELLPPSVIACFAVIIASYLALLSIVATSPTHAVYDEGWYVGTIALLQQNGLSIAFLRNLPGPAGPTFTLVYSAVQHLIGLNFPWLRLAGFVFLLVASALLAAIFTTQDVRLGKLGAATSGLLLGGAFGMLPTVAVAAGMTLTEIPATVFVLIATLALSVNDRGQGSLAACMVAGLALGVAVLGRQNYLVTLPCLALLIDWKRFWPSFGRLFLVGSLAVLMCGTVFLIWGGLTPPKTASFGASILPWHFILSAGYLGLLALLIEPSVYATLMNGPKAIGIILVSLVIAAGLAEPMVPARTVLSVLGAAATRVIGWGFPVLIASLATAFVAIMAQRLYRQRHDRVTLFASSVAILCAVSNIDLAQFSSRYIFVALPFLLISLGPSVKLSWHLPARLALGSTIGLVSLASYLR